MLIQRQQEKQFIDILILLYTDQHVCIVGNTVDFVGKKSIGFRQYCCYRCSRLSPLTMKRMKDTCAKKYGGIGFASKELTEKSENTSVARYGESWRKDVQQASMRSTKLKRYGNCFYSNREQAMRHTDYAKTYEKYKQTMQKRYGVDNYYQTKICREKCSSIESIEKAQQTRIQHGYLRTSSLEQCIYEYITTNFKYTVEQNKRKYLNGKEIDIYLPELKLGFEIQGDFFHKNPLFYKNPNELANLPRTNTSLTVQDIWNADNFKIQLAKTKNITLIQLWEYDIKHNFNNVKKQIDDIIHQSANT